MYFRLLYDLGSFTARVFWIFLWLGLGLTEELLTAVFGVSKCLVGLRNPSLSMTVLGGSTGFYTGFLMMVTLVPNRGSAMVLDLLGIGTLFDLGTRVIFLVILV